jgi:SAM-dependent methyltransferase
MPEHDTLWEGVSCPACEQPDSKPHRTVPSICSELLFNRPDQPVHLVCCRGCGLIYVNPRPAAEIRTRLFTRSAFWGSSFEDYLKREEVVRSEARQRLAEISRYMPPGRLLDVGSCCGFFLDEARKLGWSVKGIELSAEFSEYARRRFQLEIVTTPAENLELLAGSIDLVTFWGVLEFTCQPAAILQSVHRALVPGGRLFFSVANIRSLDYLLLGARWPWLYPPAHLVHFSRRPLALLLQRAGFQMQRLWSESGPDDLLAAWAKSLVHPGRPPEPAVPSSGSGSRQSRRSVAAGLKMAYRGLTPLVCRLGWGGKLLVLARKPDA